MDKAEAHQRLLHLAESGKLTPAELAPVLNTLSAADGLFWLKFVRTRDEADPETPLKPFPVALDYVRALWAECSDHKRVVIAKSRQMLVSWTLAAFCCHWARYKPNQAIYWQSQKEEDANAMVALPVSKGGGYMGRIQFIEANLPQALRQSVRCSEGQIQYPNGSIIQAIAGGGDQIRSKVVSVYVGDEFAFQLDAKAVYTAIAPLVQKGAKAIFVSTPNGDAGQFADLWHGRMGHIE